MDNEQRIDEPYKETYTRFGAYEFFVNWSSFNPLFSGFYESNVYKRGNGFHIVTHDGGSGTYQRHSIYRANTRPAKGDRVLAYCTDIVYFCSSLYAYSGVANRYDTSTRKWQIHFDDGDIGSIPRSWVHKMVPY